MPWRCIVVWVIVVTALGCSSGPERAEPTAPVAPLPAPPSTTPPAATVAPPVTAGPTEPIEAGPFLTEGDVALPSLRASTVAGARAVIVPPSVASPSRPGGSELYALSAERFVYLDQRRLAILDAERGRVLGTRVLDEDVACVWSSFSTDLAGRLVAFARSDGRVCVWDLDLDRLDCTPGDRGIVSPGGRSLFVDLTGEAPVRLDLGTARRHTLDGAPPIVGATRTWAISPSEQRVVFASDPLRLSVGQVGTVWMADAASGAEVRRFEATSVPRDPFRPQGGTWVTWSDGFLSFRDTLTGALRRREAVPFAPTRMYWSPDGASVVAYWYRSHQGRALRFDATTGEPRGEISLRSIEDEFFTPGFRPDGSFDFFDAWEVPSRTGRTAARVDDVGTTFRHPDGTTTRELRSAYEEDTLVGAVSTRSGLFLVTPFGYATLAPTGLSWSTLGLLHFVEDAEDDPPDSDEETYQNYGYSEAGLLALGGGLFVERYTGTPYRATDGSIGQSPGAALPCDSSSGRTCCLASGSFDERTGRRVLRTLDQLALFGSDPAVSARTLTLARCDDACVPGSQCDGEDCVVETMDDVGDCSLRPTEEPRFDAAGRVVVTAGHDGVVETFDVDSGRRLGRVARALGEELPAQAFDLAPDGSTVAFARGQHLHLHEVSGARRGTVEARFPRSVRFVRYVEGGALLVGLVDDSLHFVDGSTLVTTSTLARPGFRADAPSRLASVLCREGTLLWLEHRPGASVEAARAIGRCDRDATMIVTTDLAFVVEVRGSQVRVHRVDDGRTVLVSLGHRTSREDVDEDERPESTPWAIAMDEAGAIERTPTTAGEFSRRIGGVRSGAATPLPAMSASVISIFMSPSAPAQPSVSPPPTAPPPTAPATP